MTHKLHFDPLSNLPWELPEIDMHKKMHDGMKDPDNTSLDRDVHPQVKSAMERLESGYRTLVSEPRDDITLNSISGETSWAQERINAWQDEIFGLASADPFSALEKLEDEVKELRIVMESALHGLSQGDHRGLGDHPEVRVEIADVVITAYHLAGIIKVTLQPEIDSKMERNVKRKWNVNSRGSGQHVEGT